jgi:hypothetical protein
MATNSTKLADAFFLARGGSGGDEAVEVSGAVGWLDKRIGKVGLKSIQKLV